MDPLGDADLWVVLNGSAIVAALLAVLGTWVISVLLLRAYRRRVWRGMRQASGQPGHAPPPAPLSAPAATTAPWVGLAAPTAQPQPALARRAHRRARRAQLVLGLAGLTYGLVAAVLTLSLDGIELLPVRTLVSTLLFAWPIVPTLLSLRPAARPASAIAAWTGYLVVVVALGLVGHLRLGQALLLIVLQVLLPALLVVPTVTRSTRGAAWLVAPSLFLIGLAGWLGLLPVAYLLLGGSLDRVSTTFVLIAVACIVVLACYVVALLAAYRRKLLSDELLSVLQWWFVAALWLTLDLTAKHEARGLAGLLPLLVFVAIALFVRDREREPPARLLLLRTFGARGRSTRLLRALTRAWRWVGSVELITAPDIATEALEPDEFMEFVTGRIQTRFVTGPESLQRRLATLDLGRDSDGRYRINEFLCHDDTWQPTVQALVAGSDAVLVDLRGFSSTNRGVEYELGLLVGRFDLARTVGLVDESTDLTALQSVLQAAANSAPPEAPVRTGGSATLQLITQLRRWQDPRPMVAAVCAAIAPEPRPAASR